MDLLSSIWDKFASTLYSVLPLSPFAKYIDNFNDLPYLGYLNWFIPIKACLVIFAAYLSAVALYYLYSVILRWLKAIQ